MKYGVFRLDIYHRPGWMLMKSYDNLRDAMIYADMLNTDTGLRHAVFELEEE